MNKKIKGIVFYYSGSGNTKLACKYMSKKSENIDLELFNVVKNKQVPELDTYDIVGFATFIDFGGPPFLFEQFIENLPELEDKLAFVFMTFGFKYGRGLRILAKRVNERGFRVITGHTLKVPESYPPANVRGIGNVKNPVDWRLKRFNEFILEFNTIIKSFLDGNEIETRKLKLSPMNRLFPEGFHTPTRARDDMGEKFVDEDLCVECGTCEKGCPYKAITLEPKPTIDMTKCYGCWYCYNHCPEKAIYTKKFRGQGHYPSPNTQLREKLTI